MVSPDIVTASGNSSFFRELYSIIITLFFRKDIALKNKNKTTFDLHSENIATYKPATQSTTHHRSDNADKAVDGNKGRSVSLDGEFCSNTKMSGQTIAWWQVDLQNNYTVHGISITPKMKGKRFWLRPTAYTSFFGSGFIILYLHYHRIRLQ